MRHEKQIKFALMLSVNLVLFYFLSRWVQTSIRWEHFKSAFLDTPVSAAASALVIGLILLVLYGQRLAYLIDRGLGQGFWIVCYGFGANSVLPFRIGDALKLYFAKRYYRVSATRLLLIKVMEKFFDLFFLLCIGLLALLSGVIAVGQTPLLMIAAFLAIVVGMTGFAVFLIQRNDAWLVQLRQQALIGHWGHNKHGSFLVKVVLGGASA